MGSVFGIAFQPAISPVGLVCRRHGAVVSSFDDGEVEHFQRGLLVGKWPRRRVAALNLAFSDSIAFVV